MAQEATGSAAPENKEIPDAPVVTSAEMTAAERAVAAERMIDHYTLWSGAAGLVPIPLADIVAVGGVQVQMLRKLSELYGVPFSDNMGKSVIAGLVGSLLPASAATTTAMGITSALKLIPGVGTIIAAVTMPAYSAGATYLIGKVFAQHFATGGTLLDFNPPDYREFIKTQKEKLDAQRAKLTSRYRSAPATAEPAAPSAPNTSGKETTPVGT